MRARARSILAMNQRNLAYIYPNNARRHFPLADDKLLTKRLMQEGGVPVPRTYLTCGSLLETRDLGRKLAACEDFVIKPAQGRGGSGVLVVSGRDGDAWVGSGGRRYSLDAMRKHISDILAGVYSFDLADTAIVEERVRQHSAMSRLSPFGLADIRVILFKDEPVFAMSRIPTRASQGRANLHQGAVGVGIDLDSGQTVHAIFKDQPITEHPETGLPLVGQMVPEWSEVMRISRMAAHAVPLKYLGVDICVSAAGPILLEINVRPGLEIQNANAAGLRDRLESVG